MKTLCMNCGAVLINEKEEPLEEACFDDKLPRMAPDATSSKGPTIWARCYTCITAAQRPNLVLRPGAVTMVRRALAMYRGFYDRMARDLKHPQWEREEDKARAQAADNLSESLRLNGRRDNLQAVPTRKENQL